MTVSLYKVAQVKLVLEELDFMSIPIVDETDIDSIIAMFVVGLADKTEKFNNLLNAITGTVKLWDEDYVSAVDELKSFFLLIPKELSIMIGQLKSVSSTLEDVVTRMMQNQMTTEPVELPENEQN